MLKRNWQLDALVLLLALAASAWWQTARYAIPAASVGDDFSVYHQAVSNAADLALANAALETEISSQLAGVATNDTIQPDATILHDFARKYWNGNDDAVRRAVSRMTQMKPILRSEERRVGKEC